MTTTTRDSLMQRLAWGVAALAVALVTVGCAASEAPRADASASQQRAAEVDLTGAHLDKRKFLLGISMLGKSVEQDIELLRMMTGHTFEPKEAGYRMSDGSRRFRAIAPLSKNSPMLIGGGYSYTVGPGGAINSMSTDFVFNKKAECISVEDLESVYGPPTQVIPKGLARRKGLGPSYIWSVIYDYSSGGQAVFTFSTDVCVNDVVHSSVQTLRRP